ncbi:COX assembly mitochondrial protein [Haematococcus lacustris]|uniref:COX assembly mitochondrial protein n=1 Tax=Haematococcus lacustris TaxID=44745 RepID=A0A699Y9A8_HAELA|nr:COX assembly mitochondrial protein [Haematococcus lacustris]
MHPQLIPEKHPMCGKYMEALVACRKANPFDRFRGACNDITLQLSKCLVEEKQQERAPRQAQSVTGPCKKQQQQQEEVIQEALIA